MSRENAAARRIAAQHHATPRNATPHVQVATRHRTLPRNAAQELSKVKIQSDERARSQNRLLNSVRRVVAALLSSLPPFYSLSLASFRLRSLPSSSLCCFISYFVSSSFFDFLSSLIFTARFFTPSSSSFASLLPSYASFASLLPLYSSLASLFPAS